MPFPALADQRGETLAVIVIGTDAALACLPATPVQLAHACLRAGYRLAVPASWGDELIAADCLRLLGARGQRPAIMCACPHVRDALLDTGSDLAPMLVPLVAPPVAVARYLHGLYGRDRVHLTYLGVCPAANHPDINERRDPADFLEFLSASGIRLADQPTVFDSVIPPDRRRFYSVAGGLPSAEQLWGAGNARSLVELDGEDYLIDLAQHLLSHECALIDLAPRLGCVCSGASANVPVRSARAAVAVIEPPRAASTVVDPAIPVELTAPIPLFVEPSPAPPSGGGRVEAVATHTAVVHRDDAGPDTASHTLPESQPRQQTPLIRATARRRSTIGVRAVQVGVPVARIGSRWLPRAYVAKRGANAAKRHAPSTAGVASSPQRPPVRAPERTSVGGPLGTAGELAARPRSASRTGTVGRAAPNARPASAIAAGAPPAAQQRMEDPPRT